LKTVTNNAQFLQLVKDNKIIPSLKSYSDTLLFYYIGFLALSSSDDDIIEIGVGGSTYVLYELSEKFNRTFQLVDISKENINTRTHDILYNNIPINHWVMPSEKLHSHKSEFNKFAYCHIDGSKDYNITISDLMFCLNHLGDGGIICQDDYGNNKWPTITSAITELIYTEKVKPIIVGDSSIWITKPEYYEYWMNKIKQDNEMEWLGNFVNLVSSKNKNDKHEYYYINFLSCDKKIFENQNAINYFDQLLSYGTNKSTNSDGEGYLQMPYIKQSAPGYYIVPKGIKSYYYISSSDVWDNIKGDDWPSNPPRSLKEINELPNSVKQELKELHKINIFELADLYKC